jgi:prophage regulatory protein
MKLIDLLATGKQIKTIPKSDIPLLLGEIETLKAQLWLRLTEWEGRESVAEDRAPIVKNPAKQVSHDPAPGPHGRILRMKDVVQMVSLSKATIWNMVGEGRFPKQRKIGVRSVGWLDMKSHEWIKGRFGGVLQNPYRTRTFAQSTGICRFEPFPETP